MVNICYLKDYYFPFLMISSDDETGGEAGANCPLPNAKPNIW